MKVPQPPAVVGELLMGLDICEMGYTLGKHVKMELYILYISTVYTEYTDISSYPEAVGESLAITTLGRWGTGSLLATGRNDLGAPNDPRLQGNFRYKQREVKDSPLSAGHGCHRVPHCPRVMDVMIPLHATGPRKIKHDKV